MSTYLYIGGAYGDDYRQSQQPPTPDDFRLWSCGELLIFKIDSEMRIYEPGGISGMWGLVKQLPAAKG